MIMRGHVTRVRNGAVYVRVARYGDGEFGPLPYLRHRVDGDWSSAPQAGDRVALASVEDNPDELIVIGVQRA